jgi:hypothetical protein
MPIARWLTELARESGGNQGARPVGGRPRIEPAIEKRIQRLRANGILKIARELGVGTSAVQRVVAAD